MTETRRFTVRAKRFYKTDLLAIGQHFVLEAETARQAGRRPTLTFTLGCDDGTEYTADTLVHFSDGAEIDIKKAHSIEFYFGDGALDRRIRLSLQHGRWSEGSLSVAGGAGYRDWVAGVFTKLRERIQAVEPSESWFTKHPTLTYHLLALGCGSVLVAVLDYLFSVGVAHGVVVVADSSTPPEPGSMRIVFSGVPALELLAGWLVRWVIGGFAAFPLRQWVLSAWPPIDIHSGPQHLNLEARRRQRIAAFLGIGVGPVVVQVFYDVAKRLL